MSDSQPTAFIPRPLKVVVIGAGFSGIQFAHEVTSTLPNIDLEIFEKNPCLGGTWYENRYPGCTCDIPSHTYQYTRQPNPSWSKLYPPASEIKQYLETTVDQHDLRKYMRFNWKCVSAKWEEGHSRWLTTFKCTRTEETKTVESDVLVYAVGRLNNFRLPDLEGQDRFRGLIVHTASWPEHLDVSGKNVVVVGNGASAVQCVPAIQPKVSKLVNIARSPTWIVPHILTKEGCIQRDYSPDEIERLRTNEDTFYQNRLTLERSVASGFRGLWKHTPAQTEVQRLARSFMESKIKSPSVRSALIPDFAVGCRRSTPGEHYLDALQQLNVQYVQDSVTQLDETAVITGTGERFECDVLVCATGFVPYQPQFPVVGRAGVSLNRAWDFYGPCESYMASMVAGLPNFFAFNPPICPVSGSAIPGIERAANYIVRVINRLQSDDMRSVCVKEKAQKDFNKWVQSRMPEMAWSGSCNSWYKNATRRVIVPWPGTTTHYYAATNIIRWEDFDLEFRCPEQKYNSFGNGVTLDGLVPDKFPWLSKSISARAKL
ncbi:monooxygenase [Aspergillus avenaceus]|uniref:Monooxygenase n=1 Tax=Aspergillus avenaceus TaxID=36643 RepID=A0A5N6TYM6_ASPAV|nr:monooxygenase [Aspergillus avenaceus]